MLPFIAGLALLLAWGVLWLLEARWKLLPVYHRPRLTHGALYQAGAGPLRKTLLAAGLLALTAAHWAAGASAAALLAAAAVARAVLTGPHGRRRRMQGEFDRLRRAQPTAAPEELLYQVLIALHPRWGPDLVKQIVTENPTVEASARMAVRLERELQR